MPTMRSTVGSNDQTGNSGAWGLGFTTATEQHCYSHHQEDATATRNNNHGTFAKSIDCLNHTGTESYDADFVSMLSTGVRLNFTRADGTARKIPALFIGA